VPMWRPRDFGDAGQIFDPIPTSATSPHRPSAYCSARQGLCSRCGTL
jgi:hypothetical protein